MRKLKMRKFIIKIIRRTQNSFSNYSISKKNIQLGKNVLFKKHPIVDIHKMSNLEIGDNVIINSRNNGYHVNMFSPCKLVADRPGGLIEIGNNTRVHGSCIHAYGKISIGNNCLIAANCQIIDGNGHDLSFPDTKNRINTIGSNKDIIIEDNVWLSTGVVILPGVKIGEGSVITANSVIHKEVPSNVIAGGNPMKIIKDYNS
jgi:acetyltransferase-like isoleucine patch superfamily enzyme